MNVWEYTEYFLILEVLNRLRPRLESAANKFHRAAN